MRRLIIIYCMLALNLSAQEKTIFGLVLDQESDQALSYSTIQIYNSVNDQLLGGGITGDNGRFEVQVQVKVERSNAYALIDYIGYETFKTEVFEFSSEKESYDLGTIKMSMSAAALDEIIVTAEKSSMEFSLDKRVFNVGKDLGNAGGSAADLLNNIPSVLVDVEGNVKLRGSSNVRLLIDGKPSGLVSFEGANGLQQLQGSLIEKVEIITNPSARYEAEGMSGIINIILKKNRGKGFNGSFETTLGHPANIGLAANLNYRHHKLNFFFNYGMNYRRIPSVRSTFQEVFANDTTFVSEQSYDGEHVGLFNNARGGLDYYFNDQNILTASYMYSRSKGKRLTDLYYYDYLKRSPDEQSETYRTQDEDEIEPIAEYVLSYKKLFDQKDRELIIELRYFDHWEDSDQVYTQRTTLADGSLAENFIQTAPNDETEKQLIGQLDYIHPFGSEGKFEAGVRTSFRDMTNDYVVNDVINGQEIPIVGLDNKFVYEENINAIYGIIGNKTDQFSYQFGLRTEWTDIETILEDTDEKNPRNYANFFPSMHFSYDLINNNALQLSYGRRVRRPVYNELSSYVTFSDNRNFFSGNPKLNPEFSDVIELGHIKYFDKGSFASSIYYRHTDDKIERIRSVNDKGFSETFPENLIGEKAYGAEFTSAYKLYDWWKLDFSFNYFHAMTDGSNISEDFISETNSWFTNQTSRFTLAEDSYLQIRANYEAAQQIAQGERKAIWFVDIGFNKPVFNKKGTLTINIIDVFNTKKFRTITRGTNFNADSTRQRNRRQINLTIGYKINQS